MLSIMKKYFLMLATMAAALFVSCEKDKPGDNPPPPPPPAGTTVLNEAVYYGEKLGKDFGYYSMTFTNGDDKLRLDIFSGVASDADNAKPVAGQYELGTQAEPTIKTFFLAGDTNAEIGTLYWDNGTPVMVTGGEVSLQVAAGGGFRAAIKLQAGDTEIDWDFNGSKVTFINKYEAPPRTPVKVGGMVIAYLGDYNLSSTPMDDIAIQLESADDKDPRALILRMPVPTNAEKDKIEIPTGTFQVVKDPQEPYKIAAGYPEGALLLYSREDEYNPDGSTKRLTAIDGGTVTITRDGNKLSITTNLEGTMIDSKGVLAGKVTDIIYNLEPIEVPQYVEDFTTTKSTLTEDKVLENYPNLYMDGWTIVEDGSKAIYRLVFSTEGLEVVEAPNYGTTFGLAIRGEGDLICLQYICDPKAVTGTYPVADGYAQDIMNTTLAGMLGLGDILALQFAGTNYAEIRNVDGRPTVVNQAGAIPGKGSITVTETDKSISVEVDLYDRYDHHISGTLVFDPSSVQAVNALKTMGAASITAPVSNFNRYAPVRIMR